jgi:flagellar biogenesis protein FliO
MLSSGQAPSPQSLRRWMPVAVIGLVAVTAGIALPRALPSAPEAVKAAPAGDSASKGALAYTPPTLPEMPDPRSMLTRLGLATAGVLALCFGTIWFGRRWLGGAAPPAGAASHLRLIETLPLGNRCALHLIYVGSRQVLVAADPSGLRTVVPLPESFEQALTATPEPDLAINDPEGSLALSEKNHGRYSEAR